MPGPRKQSFAKPKNAKGTFRRILKYFKPYRGQLVLVLIGLLASVAANIAGTFMLVPIINVYIIPWIGNENPDFTGLIGQLAVMAAVYTIGILGTFMYNRLMINVSTGTLTRLRLEMFTKMQTLPISYFDRRTHGEIMSTYTNDTDVMREMISQGLPSFISSAVRIVGVFTMMIVLNPILTGIAILMLVIMMLITKTIAGRSGRFFKARQDSVGKVNGYIEEMIEGQKVVKVFCHEQAVNSRFDELNETLRKNTAAASTLASIMGPIMNNLSHVTYAIIAASGGLLGVAGIIDIGTLGAFLQYTRSFSMPVAEISQQANNVLSALAGAERIFALLDEKAEEDEGDIVMVNARVNEKGELEPWRPHNANGYFTGDSIPLLAAFAQSINSVAVRVGMEVGTSNIVKTAHNMGIKSPLHDTPSISLGSSDVNLLELVNAYSTVVDDGRVHEPVLVTKIVDRHGKVIYTAKDESHQAIPYRSAFFMQQLLQGGLREYGGTSMALWRFVRKFDKSTSFGGKTGTSNNHSDAWFVGVTPGLVSGAWVGGEYRSIHFRTGALGQGSRTALPIVGYYLESVLGDPQFSKYRRKFPNPKEDIDRSCYSCTYIPRPREEEDSTEIDLDSLSASDFLILDDPKAADEKKADEEVNFDDILNESGGTPAKP